MNELDLFVAALAITDPEERSAYLERQCSGDATLRRRIEQLLAGNAQSHHPLDRPPVAPDDTQTFSSDGRSNPAAGPGWADEAEGSIVAGRYKLLQEIGEGGFGVVYLAEQEHPVRRRVALKVIKPGMDTAAVIARFEAERQALALMDHPNIAKVYDAGATAAGRPFFAMELVQGVPVTDFCDRTHLPAERRLRLFADVCHAVQHAHTKGIIHRDLKPSNVLVTMHDGVPVPKVIDFGVAKATGAALTERTLFTARGQLVGTPAYMSPEQADLNGQDIDTRTDVYALGVLLYELLTGTTPLEGKRLRAAGYAEMQRLIREEEPPRPSSRLSGLGDSATVLAGNRGMDVRRLVRLLARDLDWVVMKALEKDRNRRYDSPADFARDVQRYLNREAILARPPSAAYRARKFVQRNRVAAFTAGLVAAAILVGTAVSVWQAVRATRAERQAAADRDRAVQAEADAKTDRDRAVAEQKRAEEALKQGALALRSFSTLIDEVQKQIGDNPNMQALKLKLLETALAGLDLVARNDKEAAWQLGQSLAAGYIRIGQLFQQMGQNEKAFAQFQKAHEIIQALADRDPDGPVAQANLASTLTMLGELALELRRDMRASLVYHQKALAIRQALVVRPPDPKLDPVKLRLDLAESHTRLGVTYLRLGEPGRAAGYFQDALAIRQELSDREPQNLSLQQDVARSHAALGEIRFRARDWPAAKDHFARAVAVCERVLATDPVSPRYKLELANALGNVGLFALRTGDSAGAAKHLPRAQALMAELSASDDRNALYRRYLALADYRLGILARRQNDPAAADRWNRECLALRERLAAEDPKSERRAIELLLVRSRMAEPDAVAAVIAEFEKKPNLDREVLVELAQCYSQLVGRLPADAGPRAQYVERALDLLGRAVARGFKDVTVLETEPDLDAVRAAPGFRDMLAAAGVKTGG
jgi:serine/threonine protein kinase/tetratricopeptide (TPR) repeat protein